MDKRPILLLLPLIAVLCTTPLRALQTPWGPVTLTLSAETERDTNVFGNGLNEQDAWVFRTGARALLVRNRGAIQMTAEAGLIWEKFDGASQLDGVSPSAELLFSTSQGGFGARLSLEFGEAAEEDALRATRSRQRRYGGALAIDRRISGKWGAGFLANWSETEETESDVPTGTRNWGVSPRVTYAWNEYLDFYGGYTHRRDEPLGPGTLPTKVSGLDAGVDGRLPIRLIPRLNLTATAGWLVRSGEGSSTRGGLLGDLSLEYELSELTLIDLTAGQDFVTSLDADTGVSTRAGLRVRHRFAPRLRGTAALNWVRTSFDGGAADGEDQTVLNGLVRMTYELPRGGTLYGGLSLIQSDSDEERRNYSRTVTTVGASLDF